jgi:hypothetical protein
MNRTFLPRVCVVFGALLALPAFAQLSVSDPWVRATVQGQKATGAYMKLNAAKGTRLVEVQASVAGVAELHEMAMEGTTMTMRALPGIELPAGKAVELKPGGLHVMLMDLKQPLKAGDTVSLTLVVEGQDKKRESVAVKAQVRAAGAEAKH